MTVWRGLLPDAAVFFLLVVVTTLPSARDGGECLGIGMLVPYPSFDSNVIREIGVITLPHLNLPYSASNPSFPSVRYWSLPRTESSLISLGA